MAIPCCTGSWGCSQCSSVSPFLGPPLQRPIGQSRLSVAGRQPSQDLRQHSLAPGPTSPALLPRFNFIFIRSIKKDIINWSKGHSEHERNCHRAGAGDVIPKRKMRCFQGCLGDWETVWPEALFGRCRSQQTDCAVWSLGHYWPGWAGSAEWSQFWEHWGQQPHYIPRPPPLPLGSMLLRIKRSLRYCSIICVLQGYMV